VAAASEKLLLSRLPQAAPVLNEQRRKNEKCPRQKWVARHFGPSSTIKLQFKRQPDEPAAEAGQNDQLPPQG